MSMNLAKIRKGAIAAVASVLASSMLFSVSTATNKAFAAEITDTPDSIGYDASERVPAVETMIGRGALAVAGEGAIAVPGVEGASAALLRVSVFHAKGDTDVTVAGTPALHVADSADGSATVLAQVNDGKVRLGASAPADARVEVLAVFQSDAKAPGSTVALDSPISRVNTTDKLGLASVGAEASEFGVVGLGGVPATDVRAVYTTITVDVSSAGMVALEGQSLAVPAGRSVISTVVVPDAEGNVAISSSAALTDARVDVRGYVVGSSQNVQYANVQGSYVPVSGAEWQSAVAAEGKNGSVTLPNVQGSDLGIALVSANATESNSNASHTFVDLGKDISGRSSGVLVDRSSGALPQLEVVENTEDAAPVSVRGDSVDVNALLLGDILGERPRGNSTVNVAISSPKQDATLDFAKTGGIEITGTVDSPVGIEAVDIYGDGTKIGTASLSYTTEGGEWKFNGAAPTSGKVTYEAKAIARDGAKAKAKLDVNVELPSSDATVIDPDVVIIDAKNSPVTAVDENSITLNRKPDFEVGKIVVSDRSDGAPEGFLRWVDAIQQSGDQWKVTTHQATLTEAIMQGKTTSADSTDNAEVASVSELSGASNQSITVLDGPEQSVKLVDPSGKTESTEASSYSVSGASVAPALLGSDASSAKAAAKKSGWVDSDDRDVKIGRSLSIEKRWGLKDGEPESAEAGSSDSVSKGDVTVERSVDISAESPSEEKEIGHNFYLDGGATIGVKVEGEYGIKFGFDIKPKWDFNFTNDIEYLKAEAYNSIEGTVDVEAAGSLKWAPELPPLAKLKQGHTFYVGAPPLIVPVYVSAEAELTLEPSVTVEGKVSYTVSAKVENQLGARHREGKDHYFDGYANTKIGDSDEGKGNCPQLPDGVGVEVSLTPEIGLGFAPKLMVYDAVGPGIKITPKVGYEFKGSLDDSRKITGSVSKYAAVEGKATFDMRIPVIDKKLAHWESDALTAKISTGVSKEFDCKPEEPGSGGSGSGTGSGGSGGSSGSWGDAKQVTVKWVDPKSGKSHKDKIKAGTQIKISEADLESRLGLDKGSLAGMKGVSTQADGKGIATRVGDIYQVSTDETLNVFYTDIALPDVDGVDTDIVFVIDTTGSMSDEINGVRENVKALAESIAKAARSYRIALVDYKDSPEEGDAYVARTDVDFTTDVSQFQAGADALYADGGGDYAESVYSGVEQALNLKWRDGVKKSVFIIGDAPGKDPEPASGLTQKDVIAKASSEGVALYPLGRVDYYDDSSDTETASPFGLLRSAPVDPNSKENQEAQQGYADGSNDSAQTDRSSSDDAALSADKNANTATVTTIGYRTDIAPLATVVDDETDADEPVIDTSSFEGFTKGLADATGGTYTQYTSEDFVNKLLDIVVKATQSPDVTVGVSNIFHTGEAVHLNATTNAKEDDPVTEYDWNFGTGTPSDKFDATTATGETTTTFDKAGTYAINVTVKTKSGTSGHGVLNIVVMDKVPTTTFSGTVTLAQVKKATFVLPILPGTEGYGALTFDNGANTKTVAGEGTWTIARDGDFITATFTPEAGYKGSAPTPQTYLLADAGGNTVNGRLTMLYR